MDKKVSVIIFNHRAKYAGVHRLYSAKEALKNRSNEIFVVDNNSQDDSIEYVRTKFPEAIYIENKDNMGFSRANNQAINIANGEYCLILNPDTIITASAIREAKKTLNENKNCAAVGTKMIGANGIFLPESKRSFPTPWISFCKIFGLSMLFPKS